MQSRPLSLRHIEMAGLDHLLEDLHDVRGLIPEETYSCPRARRPKRATVCGWAATRRTVCSDI